MRHVTPTHVPALLAYEFFGLEKVFWYHQKVSVRLNKSSELFGTYN